jgi:hypothetical protein
MGISLNGQILVSGHFKYAPCGLPEALQYMQLVSKNYYLSS